MHHPRHSIRRFVAACAVLPILAFAPTAAADTRPLHLGNPGTQFTSFTCLNDSCSLGQATLAGNATSNLAGLRLTSRQRCGRFST